MFPPAGDTTPYTLTPNPCEAPLRPCALSASRCSAAPDKSIASSEPSITNYSLLTTNCSEPPARSPVIFDIVLNIENLYSISSIQQEMQAAITYYHYLGDDSLIVNDRFQVIDETRDCRQLFEALERSLDSSWDLMYAEAKKYFLSNGNLLIPATYKTVRGFLLTFSRCSMCRIQMRSDTYRKIQ